MGQEPFSTALGERACFLVLSGSPPVWQCWHRPCRDGTRPNLVNPMKPIPIPAQVPASDGMVRFPDTRLGYWRRRRGRLRLRSVRLAGADRAERALGFARRATALLLFARASTTTPRLTTAQSGIGSQDLLHLADVLGLGRFHVLASAAGGTSRGLRVLYQERSKPDHFSNSFGIRAGRDRQPRPSFARRALINCHPNFAQIG